jgi:hypothetical protein
MRCRNPGQCAQWVCVGQAFAVCELEYFGEPGLSRGEDQGLPVGEMPVHGADTDTGRAGYIDHLHLVPMLGKQRAGRLQDAGAVAFRVGARPSTSRHRWC